MGKDNTIAWEVELGIDEAGRGSLVGDMYIAGICIPMREIERFRSLGVRDSKSLTPEQRRKIFKKIIGRALLASWTIIPSSLIDERNINMLFLEGALSIIKKALSMFRESLTRIVVDLTGDKNRIINGIRNIGYRGEVIIEHRADVKYVSVGAASILAKVLRDEHIRILEKKYGVIGSGYPSDPKTILWAKRIIREKGKVPVIIRRSWSTLKKIAPKYYKEKKHISREQKSLLEFINVE